MGKTRDLFKKIRDREGIFQAKMSTIKKRHGMDLTEAEQIKKRLKEYIEELHKKILMTMITTIVSSLTQSQTILKCEIKWVFRSITKSKSSGCDGIAVQLYQILKDDAVKVLHSICQQMRKTQQWPQAWKGHFPCNPHKKVI